MKEKKGVIIPISRRNLLMGLFAGTVTAMLRGDQSHKREVTPRRSRTIEDVLTLNRSERSDLPHATLLVSVNSKGVRSEQKVLVDQLPMYLIDSPTDWVTAYLEELDKKGISKEKAKVLQTLFVDFQNKFLAAVYSENPKKTLCE